jgi:hypothetical protein
MEEDVLIQIGLGNFFAAKLRSGVLFEIYQQTGNVEAGRQALAQYRKDARRGSAMALAPTRVPPRHHLRGHSDAARKLGRPAAQHR